jgi:hypothetical protein
MLLGVPVACLPLFDGDSVELCCDRDGLLLGHPLTRRALTMFTVAPQRAEVALSPTAGAWA